MGADFTLENPPAVPVPAPAAPVSERPERIAPPPRPRVKAVLQKPEQPAPAVSPVPKLPEDEEPPPVVESQAAPAPVPPPSPAQVAVVPDPTEQRGPAPAPGRPETSHATAGGRADRGPEGGVAAGSSGGAGEGVTGVSDVGLRRGSGPRGEGGNGTGLGGNGIAAGGSPGGSHSDLPGAGRGLDSASLRAGYLQDHLASIRGAIAGNFRYPPMARRMGWTGRVAVEFVVRGDGSVEQVRVVKSSGIALLDDDAEETVRRSAPFPRPPVSARLIIPVEYVLK